jgi:hypothetical protein
LLLVVPRDGWAEVFGVVEDIDHKLPDVLVLQPVVDVCALSPRGHKAG